MATFEPDEALVARFVGMCGCDDQQAHFLLEAAHGNFERAVQMYWDTLAGGNAAGVTGPGAHPDGTAARGMPPRPRAPTAPVPPPSAAAAATGRGRAAAAPPAGVLSLALRLPLLLMGGGIRLVAAILRISLGLADRVVPRPIMSTARGLATAVIAAPEAAPEAQAAEAVAAFARATGEVRPWFVELGWRQATSLAHTEFKFLFVYLHSHEHEDTQSFCQSTLCAPEVVAYANEHFVCWTGDIRQPDAYSLSVRLSVQSFPYVALLACSGARTKLVAAIHGLVGRQQLLATMMAAQEEHGALLVAERAEQEERAMSRRMIEEQDREYEESLAADRERQRQRSEAAARAAEAERAQREAEEQARLAAEAEAQRKADAEAALLQRRTTKAAALPPEPGPGEPVAALRVRLSDGSHHMRRFRPDAPMQQVRDWVDTLDLPFQHYSLVAAFPRRVFGASDGGEVTLEAAGLVPQGALFVQCEDD